MTLARLLRSVSGSPSVSFGFGGDFPWPACVVPPGLDRSAHTAGGVEGYRTRVGRGRILLCFHASRFAGVAAVLFPPARGPDPSLQVSVLGGVDGLL